MDQRRVFITYVNSKHAVSFYERIQERVTHIPKIFTLIFGENFERIRTELEFIFQLVRKIEKSIIKNTQYISMASKNTFV